jgi:peptidoglycan/LPS O-acetylase OafA/YrhL
VTLTEPRPGPPAPAPEPAPAPAERLYYPALDGLRFVAFALVYLFHNGIPPWNRWVRSVVEVVPLPIAARPGPNLGFQIQQNGWIGVQLFFVLSGFLIARLLLREREVYGRVDLRSFWVRRILRIWPLYYATLLMAALVLPLLRGGYGAMDRTFLVRQFPLFAAFLGNWSMGFRGPPPNDAIGVLWSVCVEEQFYLLGPLLFVIPWMRLRWAVLLALMGLAVWGRYALGVAKVNPLLYQYNTVSHLDALGAGIALALLHRPLGAIRHLWLLQFPAIAALLWLLTRPDLGKGPPLKSTLDFALIWLVSALLIASVTRPEGPLGRLLAYDRVVYLGKISYGLYMLHEIVLTLGRDAFDALGWFPNKEPLQAIALLAATVLAAGLSYRYLEGPFLRRKSRWTRVPSRPV